MSMLARVVRNLPHILWFLLVFSKELIVANARVAWEVVTPGLNIQAAIVRVPTHCRTDWEMFLLANTITMTPGTLSLEVDTAARELYVHSLFASSRETFVADIHALERVILKAVR